MEPLSDMSVSVSSGPMDETAQFNGTDLNGEDSKLLAAVNFGQMQDVHLSTSAAPRWTNDLSLALAKVSDSDKQELAPKLLVMTYLAEFVTATIEDTEIGLMGAHIATALRLGWERKRAVIAAMKACRKEIKDSAKKSVAEEKKAAKVSAKEKLKEVKEAIAKREQEMKLSPAKKAEGRNWTSGELSIVFKHWKTVFGSKDHMGKSTDDMCDKVLLLAHQNDQLINRQNGQSLNHFITRAKTLWRNASSAIANLGPKPAQLPSGGDASEAAEDYASRSAMYEVKRQQAIDAHFSKELPILFSLCDAQWGESALAQPVYSLKLDEMKDAAAAGGGAPSPAKADVQPVRPPTGRKRARENEQLLQVFTGDRTENQEFKKHLLSCVTALMPPPPILTASVPSDEMKQAADNFISVGGWLIALGLAHLRNDFDNADINDLITLQQLTYEDLRHDMKVSIGASKKVTLALKAFHTD